MKSLKATVDWHSLGFEIVGEAFNGYEGLVKIKELQPDLVFTDIRMPGLDGLALIEHAKSLELQTQFIIATGYSDFEYAKRAIHYGVLDYCLKPFDEKEIIEMLMTYKKKKLSEASHLHTELLYSLQEKDPKELHKAHEFMRQLGIQWDTRTGVTMVMAAGKGQLSFPAHLPYIALKMGVSRTLYLVQGDCSEHLLKVWSDEPFAEHVQGIGLSHHMTDLTQILKTIEQLEIAAFHSFIEGHPSVWRVRQDKGIFPDNLVRALEQLNQTRNPDHLTVVFREMEQLIRAGTFQMDHAVSFYNRAIHIIYYIQEEIYSIEQLTRKFSSIYDMMDHLKSLFMKHYTGSLEDSSKSNGNVSFQMIVAYVEEHFKEDISLQSLSEKFNLNFTYISHLFRKERQDNFLKFLTKRRMEQATVLLRHTQLSIQEVSEDSGFRDYFHFAKTFKKNFGQTPTQYRESNQHAGKSETVERNA